MDSHCLLVVCSGGSREGGRGTMTMLDARRAEIFFKLVLLMIRFLKKIKVNKVNVLHQLHITYKTGSFSSIYYP